MKNTPRAIAKAGTLSRGAVKISTPSGAETILLSTAVAISIGNRSFLQAKTVMNHQTIRMPQLVIIIVESSLHSPASKG